MIFSCLTRCLRDTDFIGWYEDGFRAGAVLTELGEGSQADVRQVVHEKVMTRGFFAPLPAEVVRELHLEVCLYPTHHQPAEFTELRLERLVEPPPDGGS